MNGARGSWSESKIDAILIAVIFLFLLSVLSIQPASAQSGRTLEIPRKGIFEMTNDTLIVDVLIMNDSAQLVLNKVSTATYIKANRMVVRSNCLIVGKGNPGINGAKGRNATNPSGICRSGLTGETGKMGLDGEPGKNLTIEVGSWEVTSGLVINLVGGVGGDGGNGGSGSHGSKSTPSCTANGGNGGQGGKGGNGGNGGVLSVRCASCDTTPESMKKINLINRAGYQGLGGEGGAGGLQGQGSSESARRGATGKNGTDGLKGKDGNPLFYAFMKEQASLVSGSR